MIHERAPLMIIGAMKCGTSTLFDLLAAHPQILPSTEKEPEYFSRHQRHGLRVSSYEQLWPGFDADRHRFALEGSTGYTKYPAEEGVPERIRQAGLNPTFIYVVRDPIARIVSHLTYRGLDDIGLDDVETSSVVAISDYHGQLSRYEEVFGIQPHVVTFDDLIADPHALVSRLLNQLGVDPLPTDAPSMSARNVTADTSPWARRLRRGRGGSLLAGLPEPVRLAGKRALRAAAPPAARRSLDPQLESAIRQHLGAGMRALAADYGIDVTAWGFSVD